jgi:hypothetical protein
LKVFVKHVTMYDTANNFVLQTEDGRLGHIRVAADVSMIRKSKDELVDTVRKLLGDVELEGMEDNWMAVADKAGKVEHPFRRDASGKPVWVSFEEMPLDFSNYLARDWSRWMPRGSKAELLKLEEEALELQEKVQPLARKINDILGKDYFDGENLAAKEA